MADNNPSPNSNIRITPGPWRAEDPSPWRNNKIAITAEQGHEYTTLFIVSSSPSQPQEYANAQAAAAIPELLGAIASAPLPPSEHLSSEQGQQWVKQYEEWYRLRCTALTRATENPDDLWRSHTAIIADDKAQLEDQLGVQFSEVRFLVRATAMEIQSCLLPKARKRRLLEAEQAGITWTVAKHRGDEISVRFTPVYVERQLVLFWSPVRDFCWYRFQDWVMAMVEGEIKQLYNAEDFDCVLDTIKPPKQQRKAAK